jgi:hypothetical protein
MPHSCKNHLKQQFADFRDQGFTNANFKAAATYDPHSQAEACRKFDPRI